MKTTLTADERQAAKTTAVHECGHFLIAERFGLHPSIGLLTPRDGYCIFNEPPSPEAAEALCWGGFMAEDLLGFRKPGRAIPTVRLSEEKLDEWIDEIREAEATNRVPWLSASDRSQIHGFQRNSAPLTGFYILAERQAELAELADYAIKLFTPSLDRNQGLNLSVLRAALTQTGGSRYPQADSAAERLAPLESSARNLEKDARQAASAAHAFASDLDRLGKLATPEAHRQAAELHATAAKLFLEAKRAAEAHNIGWAREFSDAVAAGDQAAAHSASWNIAIKKPIDLKRSADKELQSMLAHRKNLKN